MSPTAVQATPASPPPATATLEVAVTPEATAMAAVPLLRDWSAMAETATPPMAPIQLLGERVSISRTYPVARSIVTLVREAVDHIQDHIHSSLADTPAAHVDPAYPTPAGECLSIRSEGGMAQSQSLPQTTSVVPEQVRMDRGSFIEDLEDQYVLIDGDLIALPPAYPPNEQERQGLEEYQRDQDFIMTKSCQPKPMRRGVRGFKKWIKKRMPRKDKDKDKADKYSTRWSRQQQQQQDEAVVTPVTSHSPNISQCEPFTTPVPATAAEAAVRAVLEPASAANPSDVTVAAPSPKKSARNKSPMRGWKKGKRDKNAYTAQDGSSSGRREGDFAGSKKERKHRLSWRIGEPKRMVEITPPSSPYTSSHEATATKPPSSHAAAAMPEPDMLQPPTYFSYDLLPSQLQPPTFTSYDSLPSSQSQPNVFASYDSLDPGSQHAYAVDALAGHPPPPSGPPSQQASVHASFVGNADQVFEADVLGATCAEAYIESAYYPGDIDKKDEPAYSVLPPDADYKVDKADAPDVEYMLRRAAMESANDDVLEPEVESFDPLQVPVSRTPLGKSSGLSCPLSTAKVTDELVHNDVLKVVMVGAPTDDKSTLARAIRQSNKKPKRRCTLGVDVHSWTPDMGLTTHEPVKFSIWDVQGASREDGSANFGANPGIQSLFFSANALYLLVWDLAADNMKTYSRDMLLHNLEREDENDDEDDDEEDNEFLFEEAKRQADLALQADIEKRVLTWVECISKRGPRSSILPVAVIPEHMNNTEAKRRCGMMQDLLERHINKYQNDPTMPKLLIGMDNVMCVSLANNEGIHELQETLIAIAADESVFDHVGTPVSSATVRVLDTVRRLKQDHKLVRVDHLMSALGKHIPSYEEITQSLHFLSSIGELLYFGNEHDELLSRYIILSRKWFVSALSCILRNELSRELKETRRFMNMQCIYSNQQFPENPVIQSLTDGSASSCPLLSSTDTNMLWLSMQFMREAVDRSSQLSENSTTSSTMFGFLERLLVQSGVFLPLNVSRGVGDPEVFFVPSLVATATDNNDVWTFKSSEAFLTTLCHSWLFRDGARSDLMEHITAAVVRDLYEFSGTFATVDSRTPPHRSQTFPLVRSGATDFLHSHDKEAIGRVKIHQIMCWQSSFLVKIGSIYADSDNGELKESFTEVFVTLVDQSSSHCVASDAMRATMQRLVVSGKGQAGSHGAKLWKGGLDVVLSSIQSTLGEFSNIDRQVVCPECLSHSQPRHASTWSWDSVKAAAESGSSIVRCIRGHRVDSNLICGITKRQDLSSVQENSVRSVKPVPELLHSVVLVGLWDPETKEIRNVGSGFIVDKRLGLVVTAGHVLFNMKEGSGFGAPYFGLKNAKVVIGVIPDGGHKHNAVYRYFAEIIADDISGVDACVVRLTTKINNDVDGDLSQQSADALEESPLNLEAIHREGLRSLKLTTRFELEESVRILGFNQGGEGLLEQGKHVNRSADFAKGYICKKFVAPPVSDDSSHSSEQSSKSTCFVPREEVVVICPTIAGHSGGPCVNNEGKVIGILSRADPSERQRCYLVPSSELKDLMKKAKKHFTRPMLR